MRQHGGSDNSEKQPNSSSDTNEMQPNGRPDNNAKQPNGTPDTNIPLQDITHNNNYQNSTPDNDKKKLDNAESQWPRGTPDNNAGSVHGTPDNNAGSCNGTPETKRIWMSYRNGVYDITDYVERHPGGNIILKAAG